MGKRRAATSPPADVLIIGGGIAGLACALGVQRSGLRPVVLEASKRLGGRAQSWTDEKSGDPIHIGPHVFMNEYPNMLQLLDWLGTRERIVWQDDQFITLVKGRHTHVIRSANLPAPLQFAPSVLFDPDVSAADILSNARVSLYAMQMDEDDVLALDPMNAYGFLRRMGVSERYIRSFWAFTCMAIMNVPVEVCSAGALMRFYSRMLKTSRYYFGFADGGLGDVFAPAAQAHIEAGGGEVRLGREVAELEGTAHRISGVRLADGTRLSAKAYVCALPPHVLRRIVNPELMKEHPVFQELTRFQPCPYVSPYVWLDRKLTHARMWARHHAQMDLNCDFYDLSNINRGWEDRPSLITSNIIYSERAAHLSDEEIVQATVRELSEFLPAANMSRVTHWVVNRTPMAIHCPFPNTERYRPETRSPVGNLYLAGDWVKTHLPSSMESAAMSGWLAAEEVLRTAGRPATLAHRYHEKAEGISAMVAWAARWMPPKMLRRLGRRVRGALPGSLAA
ncbi:MAG: hydroxysqualene dehydroxylase [Myxococcaceae bacterium]